MPVYEYACESCEKITEEMQKFSDAPLVDCESCGARGTLRKLISRSSFALKGNGWYTSDYKRAPAPAASSPSAAATPATESKAPAAEAKPAAST